MLSGGGEWLHDVPVSLALPRLSVLVLTFIKHFGSSSPASLSLGQLKEKVDLINVPCGWELAVVLSRLEHLRGKLHILGMILVWPQARLAH